MKNIVLIGFMGTGKTIVGKALADKLAMRYVSTDDIIEEKEGRTISDIFEKDGEAYFREVERAVIRDLSDMSGLVVDTGGGVVLNHDNILDLKKDGIVFCLCSDPEIIFQRTAKHGDRPLLKVDDPLGRIRELMDIRDPHYKQADHFIDSNTDDIDKIAGDIISVMRGI